MSSSVYSPLSVRDLSIIRTVFRFRHVSSNHILRLYFSDNSPASRRVRCTRSLRRLVKWGQLGRIDRAIGGHAGGSSGYVYVPPHSKARIPNGHSLDLTEIFVRLVELGRTGALELLAFDGEPESHVQVGHTTLKPDGYTRLRTEMGTFQYFAEIDQASEYRSQLAAKMRRYVRAYEHWSEPTFPLCVWICHDDDRKRFIESVVKRQEMPGLFTVCLFEDALERICGVGV